MKNKKFVLLNVRCPEDVVHEIDELAKRDNISRSSYVNQVLARHIRNEKQEEHRRESEL